MNRYWGAIGLWPSLYFVIELLGPSIFDTVLIPMIIGGTFFIVSSNAMDKHFLIVRAYHKYNNRLIIYAENKKIIDKNLDIAINWYHKNPKKMRSFRLIKGCNRKTSIASPNDHIYDAVLHLDKSIRRQVAIILFQKKYLNKPKNK